MKRLKLILPILIATSGMANIACLRTSAVSYKTSASPTPIVLSNSNANAGLYALDETKPPPTKSVRVPANVMWFDTGIFLKERQKFSITAEGRWWLGKISCGPLGTVKTDQNALLSYVNLGALVAKVGDEAFIIGDRMQMPSPGTGNLYLSINAAPKKFKVNKGSLHAWITYGTAPE